MFSSGLWLERPQRFGCKGLKLHGFKTLGLLGFGPTHEKALGLRFLGPAFCRAQGCDKYSYG